MLKEDNLFFFSLESLRVIGQGICENAGKSVVICILHYPNVFQNSISPKQHVVEKANVVYSSVFTDD